jgi:hypothetical protein
VIARRWRAWTDGQSNADAYAAHFEGGVRPALAARAVLAGYDERVRPTGD